MALVWSLGRSVTHAAGLEQREGDFEALMADVLGTVTLDGKDGPYFCGPLADGRRCADAAQPFGALVLDLDEVGDADNMARIVEAAESYSGFGHTTFSHSPEASACKLRLVIELDRPVTRGEYSRLTTAACAELEQLAGVPVAADAAGAKPEQPMFTARRGATSWRFDGKPLAVDAALAKVNGQAQAEPARERASERDIDPVLVVLRAEKRVLRDMDGGKYAIRCPFEAEHSQPHGAGDSSTVYMRAHTGGYAAGHFACKHAHCAGRTDADYRRALGIVSAAAAGEGPRKEPKPPPGRFKFLTVRELLDKPAPVWRLLRVIPEKGLVVVWGASGSGKTFLALDLAAAIARGIPWAGRRTKRGRVVYIAAEGALKPRVSAYRIERGITSADLDGLRVLDSSVNMLDPRADMADLLADLAQLASDWGPIGVVIVDTLSRVMPGGNENMPEDMGALIASAKRIEESLGCVVIFIHHAGKDESRGSRGHSSLKAACDAELSVKRDSDTRCVTVEKCRDGADGEVLLNFTLSAVDLGAMRDIDPGR